MQSAQERAVEERQQERSDRRPETGRAAARGIGIAGVSRADEHGHGQGAGAHLYGADRRHYSSDEPAESAVPQPGDRHRGQEAIYQTAAPAVAERTDASRSPLPRGTHVSATR